MEWLDQVWEWLKDLLLWVPKKIWQWVTDGLARVIESIPVPDWLQNAPTLSDAISPEMGWALAAFEVPAGLSIIGGAYLIRFLIRRIPLIG